jgi:hypothetical protein
MKYRILRPSVHAYLEFFVPRRSTLFGNLAEFGWCTNLSLAKEFTLEEAKEILLELGLDKEMEVFHIIDERGNTVMSSR